MMDPEGAVLHVLSMHRIRVSDTGLLVANVPFVLDSLVAYRETGVCPDLR